MADDIDEAQVLNTVISALNPLQPEARTRILQTVETFFGMKNATSGSARTAASPEPEQAVQGPFSTDRSASPKEFVHEKNPESETERLACLAYYLTHYRGQPHFKTLDITQLNTEAAQIKFSNASATMSAAQKYGMIGPAPDGQKQITARGERFVRGLPDRQLARSELGIRRGKRRNGDA